MVSPLSSAISLQTSSEVNVVIWWLPEAQIAPNIPLSNYFSSENSAVKTVLKIQALAPLKEYRMPIVRSLLSMLFGNDASWEPLKLAWMRSELYPTPFKKEQCPVWL